MSAVVDVDAVMEGLTADTGLHDFGDPTFRDGLDVYVDALGSEGRLNEVGRAAAAGQIASALRTRLLVERWWSDHPELEEERVEAPVFVVGLSRSGTTALSHLLARVPGNRSLLSWEATSPVPPPVAGHYEDDPRFEAARAEEFGMLHQLNPAIASMHHDPPDMPVECLITMAQHFVSLSLPALYSLPTYGHWVLGADHTPVYRWHDRVLRLLQSGGVRGRWTLKSPHHAVALDALVARYPDARFVVTHRDPATCVASAASLAREFARTFTDPPDGAVFGGLWTDLLGAMGDGIVTYRAEHGDDRFVDVAYADLTGDPVGTVQRIQDQLGEPISRETEDALCSHAEVATQHRFGRHDYTWDEFGLERGALDERFAAYRERYAAYL